jgi:peptidoglycan/xylan/chitin deacetylase (PgdA/CDA1 family)
MKKAVVTLMHAAGVFSSFRQANRNKGLIVLYHRISDHDGIVAASPAAFEQQLDYLAAHYDIVPLSVFANLVLSGQLLPPRLAVVTIDDGYRDCYDFAFPLLVKRKVPATVFVVTDFVDRKTWLWTDKLRYLTQWARAPVLEAEISGCSLRVELGSGASRLEAAARVNSVLKLLPDHLKDEAIGRIAASVGVTLPQAPPEPFSPLTWEQVREMNSAGIEIGSHTVTHPILTNISAARLRWELRESRNRLEDVLRKKVDLLGYPNGNYDASVKSEARKAGYRCAVTADHGLNTSLDDPMALKRINTDCELAHFVMNTSGFEQFKNKLLPNRAAATAPAWRQRIYT